MATPLSNITTKRPDGPPRVFLYGVQGVGKTTLAAEFPETVWFQLEEGTPVDPNGNPTEIQSFDGIKTLADVFEAIEALITEDHSFKSLVMDTVDHLEPIVNRQTCLENNWANIEQPDYGKGWVAAEEKWRDVLSALNYLRKHRGMNIILLGHSQVIQYSPPGEPPFNRYAPRLRAKTSQLIYDHMDAVGFINYRTEVKEESGGFGKSNRHATGSSTRYIHLEERPAFYAKNRYGWGSEVMINHGKTVANLAAKAPIAGV